MFSKNCPPWLLSWMALHGMACSFLSETSLWSKWSVFCNCGFHFVCPLMHKDKRLWKFPHGRDWLWGNLHLALMGGAMLSSVTQSCRTLCDPMDCSTPGLPVHHQLWEFIQSHVRWVRDAIQPSHPLLSPSPPTFNLSQHQGLFKWVSSSHQVAKVYGVSASTSFLPMNIQDWFPLGWIGWIS